MSAKRIMFVLRNGKTAGPSTDERIEVAMMAQAFDQEVHLAYLDDGVFTLAAGPDDLAALLAKIEESDISHIWVEQQSLAERGLADLVLPDLFAVLDRHQIIELMGQMHMVIPG
ncbi:MAG TPA: sulfurtransferase TusC [Rhodospirillaceae bacterium]|nr:sulfurtransferase TusC [Rhodospirillaceae bacterium]